MLSPTEKMKSVTWNIEILGRFEMTLDDGATTEIPRRKMASLLAWLILHPGRFYTRDFLAELLWPEDPPDSSQDRFRHTLVEIRRLLEPTPELRGVALTIDRNGVKLNQGAITSDAEEFQQALDGALSSDNSVSRLASLIEAIRVYKGDLLPGFYEDWIVHERIRLSDEFITSLCQAALLLAQAGDTIQGIQLAKRAVGIDPLHEEAHRVLMRIYSWLNRPSDIESQYRTMVRELKSQMDTEPTEMSQRLLKELTANNLLPLDILAPQKATANGSRREMAGGAIPLNSRFYLVRPVDNEFAEAIEHKDSIILVKGARHTGKTSLIGRVIRKINSEKIRTLTTDFQRCTKSQLESADSLFQMIANDIIDKLKLDVELNSFWKATYGWNVNFERFMRRHVLSNPEHHFVWVLDEVDRLFSYGYSTEVFGIFRAWHNERMLDPECVWSQLTLCIAYATEAHLFIKDINQSPFNVGTRLTLNDFSLEEVEEMNRRYGNPLLQKEELERFFVLLGGNPYMVSRGLELLSGKRISLAELEDTAGNEDNVFGDSLRRMIAAIRLDHELSEAIELLLRGRPCPSADIFYRLKSAGIVVGASSTHWQFRCELFRAYFSTYLTTQ